MSILFSPPPTTPTFDVALEVCVCVCDYFFHFVSCSVFLIDLVTSVLLPLSCQSCLQYVKPKPKNLSLLLSSFFYHPPPPCNYYYYYYMQRLKESCNFLASVPGLPCAQKVEEKEGEKTRNKFFRS